MCVSLNVDREHLSPYSRTYGSEPYVVGAPGGHE